MESISHLFLHCSWTWKLWTTCLLWWDVSCYINSFVQDWLISWQKLCPTSKYNKVWGMVFFVIVWTTWECRNRLIFNDISLDFSKAIDLVKFRIAWRFKHCRRGSKDQISLMMLNIKDACVDSILVKRPTPRVWCPPPSQTLKFNVDGSARGSPSRTRICGVLYAFSLLLLVF